MVPVPDESALTPVFARIAITTGSLPTDENCFAADPARAVANVDYHTGNQAEQDGKAWNRMDQSWNRLASVMGNKNGIFKECCLPDSRWELRHPQARPVSGKRHKRGNCQAEKAFGQCFASFDPDSGWQLRPCTKSPCGDRVAFFTRKFITMKRILLITLGVLLAITLMSCTRPESSRKPPPSACKATMSSWAISPGPIGKTGCADKSPLWYWCMDLAPPERPGCP